MKTKKQELKDSPVYYFGGNTSMVCYIDLNDDYFCIKLCLIGVGDKGYKYKTYNGLVNKRNELIDKYSLLRAQGSRRIENVIFENITNK